ncbi:MAG: HesA/MoeB/ThiF family protein [Bacteroidales bacterium]
MILSPREIRRYKKQIMLSEIGVEGQEKLKLARIIVVGAGGLGCPVLQYLAAAGVGKIAIAEFDMVDESNLQRQVLYGSDDVGKLKSIIASNRLNHLNDLVATDRINLRIDAGNALRVLEGHDIIIDATDNYATRYVLNDACVILNKPMVHGAIYKHEGVVSVFNYKGGPTYRCFNPVSETDTKKNPLPENVGLMGVLPGITGTIMANEAIKLITGSGVVLSGRVLIFNIFDYSFRLVGVKNIPGNHNITTIGSPG